MACDFRTFTANDTSFVSAILLPGEDDVKGHGLIMDNSYNIVRRLSVAPALTGFNMHELVFVDQSSRALYIVNRPYFADMSGVLNGTDSGWIIDQGIHEIDVASGAVLFQWFASDHISLSESSAKLENYNDRGAG